MVASFFNFLLHYRVCFWVGSMFGKLKMKICKPRQADEDSNCLLLHAHANPAHLQTDKRVHRLPSSQRDFLPFSLHASSRHPAPFILLLLLILTPLGRSSHVSAVCLQKLWGREQKGLQLLLRHRWWLWRRWWQKQEQLQLVLYVQGIWRWWTLWRLWQQEPP